MNSNSLLLASMAVLTMLVGGAPSAAAQELSELEQDLKHRDDNVRRGAVRSLAKLDSDEAWALIVESLQDRAARVADEAQLQLGRTENEVARERLVGKEGLKSRSEEVRGRCAEALGRVSYEVDPGLFIKPLSDKDPDVRLRSAWSVERLAREGRLGEDAKGKLAKALAKLASRDKALDVRCEAFSARVAMYPEEAQAEIEEALTSKEPLLVVAGLQAAAHADTALALRCAKRTAGHENLSVRRAAVELLAHLADHAAVGVLLERLEAEQNLRLSWRIVEHLQSFSGRKSRRKLAPWKRWYEELSADWKAEERGKGHDYGEMSAAFAGLPVLSGNVAFLIDFSGSTWQEQEGGVTRKSLLDVELRRALESLPEDTYFNVMPFASTPTKWQDELVPASERNVKQALEWFEKNKLQGKGDFLSAALLALEDPRVDTIMVLTDGAPTGGKRWNMELLVPWLAEKNRYRQVVIDSLLVDASGGLVRYWTDLGERTGGRSIEIELK